MKTPYGQLLRYAKKKPDGMIRGDVLSEMQVIDVTNVAEYYWKSEKTDWALMNGDFPNIAPPFQDFFMQYELPMDIVATEGRVHLEHKTWIAAAFIGRKIGPAEDRKRILKGGVINPDVCWILRYQIFLWYPDRKRMITFPMITSLGCNHLGACVKLSGNSDTLLEFIGETTEQERRELVEYSTESFSFTNPFFLAMSMLHCKNVEYIDNTPKPASKSARRRLEQHEPIYKRYTLNIMPLRKQLRRSGHENEQGRLTNRPLSLVRGHFKDYREGRGLFGRVKELIWWDSFARGDFQDGKIDKDYNINV